MDQFDADFFESALDWLFSSLILFLIFLYLGDSFFLYISQLWRNLLNPYNYWNKSDWLRFRDLRLFWNSNSRRIQHSLKTVFYVEKHVFSSCQERGTKKIILSPHEESDLRPSDSALRCSNYCFFMSFSFGFVMFPTYSISCLIYSCLYALCKAWSVIMLIIFSALFR